MEFKIAIAHVDAEHHCTKNFITKITMSSPFECLGDFFERLAGLEELGEFIPNKLFALCCQSTIIKRPDRNNPEYDRKVIEMYHPLEVIKVIPLFLDLPVWLLTKFNGQRSKVYVRVNTVQSTPIMVTIDVCKKARLGDNKDWSWALWGGVKPFKGHLLAPKLCMALHLSVYSAGGSFELAENKVDVTMSRPHFNLSTTISVPGKLPIYRLRYFLDRVHDKMRSVRNEVDITLPINDSIEALSLPSEHWRSPIGLMTDHKTELVYFKQGEPDNQITVGEVAAGGALYTVWEVESEEEANQLVSGPQFANDPE